MPDCHAKVAKFSVMFGIFQKRVSVSSETDLHNVIYEKFKHCSSFPKAIRIQFEEEGIDEFDDLDSPLRLSYRKSNQLLVLADAAEKTYLIRK